MALSPELKALDAHLRRSRATVAERPETPTLVERESADPEQYKFVPPPAYLHSAPDGAYAVRYRFAADRPGMRYLHRAENPADLVRFMASQFGQRYVIVIELFEYPQCAVCEVTLRLGEELCPTCRRNCAEDSGRSDVA